MKPPDLTAVDNAGVHTWTGAADPLKLAASQAHLRFCAVDLSKAKDRATLFAEIDSALKLPEHFGHNWDALADSLGDFSWRPAPGYVMRLRGSAAAQRALGAEWNSLVDVLRGAVREWQARGKPFIALIDDAAALPEWRNL